MADELVLDGSQLTTPSKEDFFGFLNVYKPRGITSHDVIARLRRVIGIKQIGHTGTLDPFAEGVLPVCVGKSTRLIEYLADDKEYVATVQFGKSTVTYDVEGEITATSDNKTTLEAVNQHLTQFSGEISQMPPIYSAIKVKGKKLYEYAREGKEVVIEPRKVFIEKIETVEFDAEKQTAEILIRCSKGTYIRSIAHDLGALCCCGAHLTNLVRTQAGKFRVENAIKLEDLCTKEIVFENLINPLDVLEQQQLKVNEDEHIKIGYGQALENKTLKTGQVVILIYNDIINAVGEVNQEKILIKKVF